MISSWFHGLLFEDYVTTAKLYRNNIMCSIDTYEWNHNIINDETIGGSVIPLPLNSIKEALISFGLTFNSVDSLLN